LPRYNIALVAVVTLTVLAGCTTANQQSLGVVVNPTAETTNAERTVADTDPVVAGDANTQVALAPATGEITPAATAVGDVVSKPEPVYLSRVGFLPITGAPQGAVTSLSRSLSEQARQRNIAVSGSGDQNTNYRMKGYMSALNEGSSTTVTFYWDVLDNSGRRLFRINGFERQSGARSNPWAAVSQATYQRIASRTMNDLAIWLKRRGA